MKRTWTTAVLAIFFILSFATCATVSPVYKRAHAEEQKGNWDEAVVYYTQALNDDPGSVDIRLRLERVRRMASKVHLERGQQLWEAKQYEQALLEYRSARELDPLNRAALVEFRQHVDELERMREEQERAAEAEKLKEMDAALGKDAEPDRPVVAMNGDSRQSFLYPNKEIGEIYQALAKLAGINIVFHDSVRAKIKTRTDFIINDATFWEAFDYFVASNNHFYRLLRDNTIMIIAGDRTNRTNFEEKVVKVFYLSNADAKDIYPTLRTILPTGTRVSLIRTHNAILIRDSPQKVAIAARVLDILDKPKSEVIIDVEFLEVDSSIINDVGLQLSSYAVAQSFVNPDITSTGESAVRNVVAMDSLDLVKPANLFVTIPDVLYNFLKTSGNTRLLAKPQLRVTDGEKSELHIGARVPVRKSTFNPGSAAGVGTPVDSYEYENTGIKFTMTPRVHHNGEVTLEMDIEVSAIGAGATSTNPTFTTRNIKSKLRLADGETNLLAGLIREEEKYDQEGIAGLSDIPLLGKLFSKHKMDNGKTDIIITITPHIVRGGKLTLEDLMLVRYGTENNPGFEGMMTMRELDNYRFLRGIPLTGGAPSGREGVPTADDSEYYVEDDDEYYYEDEEETDEEEGEEPPARR